ncbi:hypothetical protein OG394_17485 [Kribbella sp. NBC_01245]|uniref:hypothetical protein n=1 Tax=Kribbella sp. NBC_01245 TaxID=2903578 RepID=UPI002E2B210E|nr:hypothetical protein [Kribbella sp. NBC_01245]
MTDISDLMRRATDGLAPESPDLVQRGMAQGLRMRRRRTVLVSAAAAGAVIATAGFAVAVQSIGPGNTAPGGVQVAGQTTAKPTPRPTATKPTTKPWQPRFALNTLRKVLPAEVKTSDPHVWGEKGDFNGGSWTIDDGGGLAEVNAMIARHSLKNCTDDDLPASCRKLADGTLVVSRKLEPSYGPGDPRDVGVVANSVEVYRPDGLRVNIMAFNSVDEKDSPKTRALPPYTVEQLTTMARKPAWAPALAILNPPAKPAK